MGIDLGGSLVKAVLCREDGSVLERICEPSLVTEGPESALERVAQIADALRATHDVASLGLGICGPVNRQAGAVLHSPILPGWHEVAVAEPLVARLGIPVMLENDSACAVLGEWWQGAVKGQRVVAGVTVGTGIGGGLVVDGKIYRGSSHWGAEFGHVAVAPEPVCPCGGHGCLTQVAGIAATLDRYEHRAGERVETFSELLRRRETGDAHAIHALEISVDRLADGVRVLLNTLNPSVFLLAGGMAQWGGAFAEQVMSRLRGTTFRGLDDTPVVTAQLGLYSGAVGAARMVAP